MSANTRMTPWTVRLSVQMYQRLLVAYPQSFRRQYGTQMAQAFRDCCREAASTGGTAGLLRYWLIAFGDLIVSALAERRREEVHMSRTSWIRLGSLAAIIGGIGPLLIYTLYAPFFLILLHIPLPMSSLLHQISTGLPHRLLAVLVVQWILYVPALIGLQARSAQRTGIAGWVGVTIALLGALIGALGYTLYWIGRGVEASVNPIVSGSVLLAIGMILYGVAALRGPALPRLNWLPLAIGVTKLLIPADPFFVAYLFGQDSPLIQLVQNIMGYGFVGTILTVASGLAPAIGWLLLGIALWPRREEVTVTQDVSLPVEPAV